MLLIILATVLLALPQRVGRRSLGVMQLAVGLTWLMALSEAAK